MGATMKDDKQTGHRLYSLSRRKVLGGIGAVGLASAGAGLGTSAYFNDTEAFTGNTLTAGKLDLQVGYSFKGADSFHAGDLPADGVLNGDTLSFSVDDVKPGDWAVVCLTLTVDDNPSYVRVTGELTEDAENSVTEPEYNHSDGHENNAPGNAPYQAGDGELAEEILVTVGSGYDMNTDSITGVEPGIPAQSSLRDVMALLNDPGMLVRGEDGHGDSSMNATAVGNTTMHADADANDIQYCFKFELPASVGNWVQTDSVGFDLGFEAIQMRHNDPSDPFNTSN